MKLQAKAKAMLTLTAAFDLEVPPFLQEPDQIKSYVTAYLNGNPVNLSWDEVSRGPLSLFDVEIVRYNDPNEMPTPPDISQTREAIQTFCPHNDVKVFGNGTTQCKDCGKVAKDMAAMKTAGCGHANRTHYASGAWTCQDCDHTYTPETVSVE